MLTHLSKIQIKKGEYTILLEGNEREFLPINNANLFIGKNNSGKSRFFRHLLQFQASKIKYGIGGAIGQHLQSDIDHCQQFDSNLNYKSSDNTFLFIKNQKYYLDQDAIKVLQVAKEAAKELILQRENPKNPKLHSYVDALLNHLSAHDSNPPFYYVNELPPKAPRAIYIPILRGMRPLDPNHKLYIQRTNFDYFHRTDEKSIFSPTNHLESQPSDLFLESIQTGEDLYTQLTSHLLAKQEQRGKVRTLERALQKYLFDNSEVVLIPHYGEDVVHIQIGDDEQFPIYELGDGIQQCVIILAACHFAEEPSFIFIEEPEMGMHPGFLLKLVDYLINETPHKFFISTHSNHLLDLIDTNSNVSAFKIEKKKGQDSDTFNITQIAKDRSLLFDLGVKASSLFMANCTIWVEGITDRLYLRAFLARYLDDIGESGLLKENYHYCFIEYQGGNLVHWDFQEDQEDLEEEEESKILDDMKALSSSIHPFLIADGDIRGKGDRVDKYKEALGDNFYVLKCKEFENLLPKELVVEASTNLFKKFTREKFNKKIGDLEDKLDFSEYNNDEKNGLGFFIDKALGCDMKLEPKEQIFATKSTTLKDKKDFCEEIVNITQTDFSYRLGPVLRELCEKIVVHIKKANQLP